MAEKKSKKKEKKIMNLNQFHETVSTSKEIDWANELEENMPGMCACQSWLVRSID